MANGELIDEVVSVQENCSSDTATLMNVLPGDYIIELDSITVTPKVYSRQPLTVVTGEDATVNFQVP